jgi:hypothetical protein
MKLCSEACTSYHISATLFKETVGTRHCSALTSNDSATLAYVMWREERFLNVIVLQRAHSSNFFKCLYFQLSIRALQWAVQAVIWT